MFNELNNTIPTPSNHWDGVEYRRISLPQYEINMAFLSEYNFAGNEKILDIGCGDGTTSRAMAAKIPQGTVLGVDTSSSMIAAAKQASNPVNIQFQLLSAQKLNFSQQFDLSTSFFCMQWVPNKLLTMQKIYHALKPGGRFLMIVPMPHPHLPSIRQKLITTARWQNYFKDYVDPLIYINDCDYKLYAHTAGLEVIAYRVDVTPVIFPSYKDFFDFMSQMTPHLSNLPTSEEKTAFMQELVNEYLKIYPTTANNTYQLNFNLVKFSAEKSINF